MKQFFAHFDLLRIAGFHRILGIQLHELYANMVEVEVRGNPFKKLTQTFSPKKSLTVKFLASDTIEIKSEKLRSSIAENNISTKLAVTSLQTIGVKTIVTTIPPEVPNIIEWISDNMEKLTRIPISLEDITLQYELLERNDEYQKIIVIIAKKKDIQDAETLVSKSGLALLGISYFQRDIANIVPKAGNHVFCSSANDRELLYFFKNSTLTDFKELQTKEAVEAIKLESKKEPLQLLTVYSNIFSKETANQVHSIAVPNLEPQYLLGFGLGVKGFLPELSPVNFSSNNLQQKSVELIGKGLLKRVTITVGILFFTLLSAETASTIYLGNGIADIQEQLFQENSKVQELMKLQDEVIYFQSEIQKQNSTNRRTTLAQSILEISEKNIDGVSLQSVQLTAQSNKSESINIKGEAVSNESLSGYLKALQSSRLISSVELKKSGISQDQTGQQKNRIMFDISIVTKK